MSNEKLFQNNLAIWSRLYPKAAVFLPYMDWSQYSFTETQSKHPNLKKAVGKKTSIYHSNKDPAREAEKWFASLDLKNCDALCIYGVGLGYIYEPAKKWLKKKANRRLIFLEDELPVIRALLETEMGSKILKDQQVELHYFEDGDLEDPLSILTDLYWRLMTVKIKVIALPFYEKTKNDHFVQLHRKISYDASIREGILSEYLLYGAAFFKNFYTNLLCLPDSYLGTGLFGKFKNVPAIICGAGPSLKKNLPLLKELGQKALIFGGGSSLNALNSAGLQPHLGAGICPNDEQQHRLRTNSAFELPFLYRNRMYHDAFKLIHGPRLYVKGSGGYDIAKWFEDKLEIEGPQIEEGLNVVNFCLELASAFGCNPIIFVGVDLAYTNREFYAPGIIEKGKVTNQELNDVLNFDNQAIIREDINGKPIYTLWKWVGESRWISDFAKNHPDVTVINSTEGGLGFAGVPNIPLKKVISKHLKQNYDLNSHLQCEIQNNRLNHVTLPKIVEVMEEMQASLVRCKEGLQVLLEENESLSERIKKEKVAPANLQSGRAALYEIEMAEEPGYVYILDIFNKMYACVLSRDLQKLRISPSKPITWSKAVKKLAINANKLKFLSNVVTVNLEFIRYALDNKANLIF